MDGAEPDIVKLKLGVPWAGGTVLEDAPPVKLICGVKAKLTFGVLLLKFKLIFGVAALTTVSL